MRRVYKYPPDVVVANPPYLSGSDEISQEVRAWEPEGALLSLDEGAWHAKEIFKQCMALGVRLLVLELSPRVAVRLQKKWKQDKRVAHVHREADLAGRERFLLVEFTHG